MYNFKDISIIVHCRIDNEERGKNATLIYNFYKDVTVNSHFIFVEDDVDDKLTKYVTLDNTDKHIITENSGNWHKTGCYNLGAKASSRKFLYFLDLDVIVHPKHICQAISTDSDLVIGYNGQALYLTYDAKRYFQEDPTYEKLESFIPRQWRFKGALLNHNIKAVQDYNTSETGDPLNRYQYCMAPNNKAVGGCVVTNRDTFFKYKGFNPNFIGWGYEDNELPTRVHKLGYNVTRINSPEALLFHLPHDPIGGDPNKSAHKDSNSNHAEMDKIDHFSKEDLVEYIKAWNV
jgi:GT2 family glycosyltransferase